MATNTTFLLIEGPSEEAAIAVEVARAVFPTAVITRARSLDEALAVKSSRGDELLVLLDAGERDLVRAIGAHDDSHLPRWAVVAMGGAVGVGGADIVAREEWNAPILARVFQSAVAGLRLRRENMRLLGDIQSLGSRITHDMRSPLGGIVTSVDALRESLPDASPTANGLLTALCESADELVKIVGQIALWANASAAPDTNGPFDMGAVVGDVMDRLEWKVQKAGATLTSTGSWPQVSGDPSKTGNVWVSLVENALAHSGPAPRIHLEWDREGNEFRFWVRDQGIGVPPERRESLQRPFHRLSDSKPVRGLGLPIVGRLVQLQGGSFGYETTPGGGSSFYFTLPALNP